MSGSPTVLDDPADATGSNAAALARRPRRRASRRRSPQVVVRRLASLPRGAGRAAPARARLRGHPVGGRAPARFRRRACRAGTDVPLLVVATPDPSSSNGGTAGAEASSMRPPRAPAPVRGPDGAWPRAALERRLPAEQLACSPRGRQSALCGAVRRLLPERGSDDEALPETLQGIIAARLDGLAQPRRGCCRTPPSSARFSGRPPFANGRRPSHDLALRSCARSSFGADRSSVAGETEYAFVHQLPRRRLRPDPARGPRRVPPPGRRVDRVAGPPGRPGRDARPSLAVGARARAHRRQGSSPSLRPGPRRPPGSRRARVRLNALEHGGEVLFGGTRAVAR